MRRIQYVSWILIVALLTFTFIPINAFANPRNMESQLLVKNANFEEPVIDGVIPGWTQTFGNGHINMSYTISNEKAYEGSYSLLLDDQNDERPLGLESDPIPIQGGKVYTATAMVNVERGTMAVYLRYFDVQGVKVGEATNWVSVTDGEWEKNAATGQAPSNATNARILIYSSAPGIARVYADSIQFEEMKMGTFENIGAVVKGMINNDGAIGDENGNPTIYTIFKGKGEVPTKFVVADALTREVLHSYPMPGVESAWGIKVATDGRVYIGTHYDGGLYRYDPETKDFSYLGRFGEETHVFSLVAGKEGKIYAGTYPNGKVYEYNPDTEQFLDLGQLHPELKYIRSLAYDAERDILYAGAGGTKSRIYKIYEDFTMEELLEEILPHHGDEYEFPYGMDFKDDRLFVKFNNGDLMILRGSDNEVEYYDPDGMDIHSERVIDLPGQPGKVMFTLSGNLYQYNAENQSFSLIKEVEDGVNFWEGKVVTLQDEEWPGQTLVAVGKNGNIIYYNFETEKVMIEPVQFGGGSPILIQSIHNGSDGKVHIAGYMNGFSSYDPITGIVSESYPLGQIESSIIRGNKMILGAYAGARILEYDPTKPFSKDNPRHLFDLRDEMQDRPFAMDYAPDRDELYVGTVPKPSSLQGALAIYNFQNEELDVFENIIPNQSIISMTYKDGLLYVGTTVYGGLGTDGPSEKEAKLFIFDPERKEKVFENTPVADRKGVTGLIVGPDGLIWGVAEDTIFTFDPETRQIVNKIAKLRRYNSNSTTWAYAFLETGIDGKIYGTSRGMFFMIDPETMDFITLNGSAGNYLKQDRYGNLYYSDNGTDLWKYTPPIDLDTFEKFFEEKSSSGNIVQPAETPLRNALNQVKISLSRGQTEQAIHHLSRMEHLLETPGIRRAVSNEARYPLEQMIRILKENLN